jgi:hypothetical protein
MNLRRDSLVAILALAAVALSIYFGFVRRADKISFDTYEVLGAVAAEETAKVLGNQGRVLVMARDTGENPSVAAELSAFAHASKKYSGLQLITVKVPVTPLLMMSTGGAIPSDQLLKAIESHGPLAAVVLFSGFPQLSDAEQDQLAKAGVKTIVVSSFHPDYRRLLDQKIIHLAIVPRPDPSPSEVPAPKNLRDRFDQDYVIVTAAEAAVQR